MFYSTLAAAAVKFYVFCVVYLRRIEACHTDELLPVFVLLSGALITQPMLGHTLSRNMLAHINARTHTRTRCQLHTAKHTNKTQLLDQ